MFTFVIYNGFSILRINLINMTGIKEKLEGMLFLIWVCYLGD